MKNMREHDNWDLLRRPGTHELLKKCYKYYDICIWSQTHWKWIEIKLSEMGMLMNNDYDITFVLDSKAMFKVESKVKDRKSGQMKLKNHWVKPLQLIWKKFPDHYNQYNTIHIDDLSRNFAMNPQCGLTIKQYRNIKSMW